MKELKLFESWADNTINERVRTSKNRNDEPIDNDIMAIAHRAMPHLSPERALSVYIANQLKDLNTKDLEQNKVINAQRKLNAEMNNTIGQLQQELQQADADIDRIKNLSGNSTKSAEERKVSVQEIEKLLQDVDQLKDKPGISDKQHEELKNKVEQFKDKSVDKNEYANFQQHVEELLDRREVGKEELQALQSLAADVAATEQQASAIGQQIKSDVEKIRQLEIELQKQAEEIENMTLGFDFVNKNKENIEKIKKNSKDIETQNKINATQTNDIYNLSDEIDALKSSSDKNLSDKNQNDNYTDFDDDRSIGSRSWAGAQFNKTMNSGAEKTIFDLAKYAGEKLSDEDRKYTRGKIKSETLKLLKDALHAPTEAQFNNFIDLIKVKVPKILLKAGRKTKSANDLLKDIEEFAPDFRMTDSQYKITNASENARKNWEKKIDDYEKTLKKPETLTPKPEASLPVPEKTPTATGAAPMRQPRDAMNELKMFESWADSVVGKYNETVVREEYSDEELKDEDEEHRDEYEGYDRYEKFEKEIEKRIEDSGLDYSTALVVIGLANEYEGYPDIDDPIAVKKYIEEIDNWTEYELSTQPEKKEPDEYEIFEEEIENRIMSYGLGILTAEKVIHEAAWAYPELDNPADVKSYIEVIDEWAKWYKAQEEKELSERTEEEIFEEIIIEYITDFGYDEDEAEWMVSDVREYGEIDDLDIHNPESVKKYIEKINDYIKTDYRYARNSRRPIRQTDFEKNRENLEPYLNESFNKIPKMRAHQFTQPITEEADDVGREFQHIEDLTYIQGPQGALKAIERLYQIAEDSSHLEVKWDGSPAITFGRNARGQFHLGDKYAKEYLTTPQKLYEYVTRKSQSESRVAFANVMMQLFSYYEQATPKSYRGFLECGLMFPTSQQPKPDNVNGVYSFKPNTVIYNVSADSPLGKRIGAAKTAAAATGYFKDLPGLDAQREAVGDHYLPIKSKDVVIIPPTFTNTQAQLPEAQLKKLHAFVTKNAQSITNFITPDQAWIDTFKRNPAKAGTDWRAMIYKYVNSQVDNPGALEQLGDNMEQWAESDVILQNAGRRPIAINKIKRDKKGKQATFFVVKEIMKLKNVILKQIEKPTLASLGISATLPTGHESGEGFVSDPYGGRNPLKLVNRGGFTAANRVQGGIGQARAAELGNKAKEALKEAQQHSDTAVIGFGRGMGHVGHMYLASAVITTAKELNADAYFYVTHTVGKDDPFKPNEKIAIYKKVFPSSAKIFKATTVDNPNMSSVLHNLYEMGYQNVVVVVGEDQKQAFQYLTKYNGKPNKDGVVGYKFNTIKVISRQETSDKYANAEGPRATPMREVLTNPQASYEKKFKVWRAAMPKALSDDEVKQLMTLAANRLGAPIEHLDEGDNPNYFGAGGGSPSAIPGTPPDLQPQPTKRQKIISRINAQRTKKFTQRRDSE